MAKEPSTSVPPAGSAPKTSDYAMGSTDRERQRLMQQGAVLRGFLASAFRAAGIRPGMRILDLGCGVGDVAMLAADLAGPTCSVVGIDRDPASVAWANKRVADVGYANIRFQTTEFQDFADSEPFDALVGRFILMYLPDPAATFVTSLSNCVSVLSSRLWNRISPWTPPSSPRWRSSRIAGVGLAKPCGTVARASTWECDCMPPTATPVSLKQPPKSRISAVAAVAARWPTSSRKRFAVFSRKSSSTELPRPKKSKSTR